MEWPNCVSRRLYENLNLESSLKASLSSQQINTQIFIYKKWTKIIQ